MLLDIISISVHRIPILWDQCTQYTIQYIQRTKIIFNQHQRENERHAMSSLTFHLLG